VDVLVVLVGAAVVVLVVVGSAVVVLVVLVVVGSAVVLVVVVVEPTAQVPVAVNAAPLQSYQMTPLPPSELP
jgi:hypothetical protein